MAIGIEDWGFEDFPIAIRIEGFEKFED